MNKTSLVLSDAKLASRMITTLQKKEFLFRKKNRFLRVTFLMWSSNQE